jgi:hypothetical protein
VDKPLSALMEVKPPPPPPPDVELNPNPIVPNIIKLIFSSHKANF